MTTYLRSGEAARRLGVTKNTLYAYVSRGRVSRTIAADGRTSLFDVDELDRLRSATRGAPSEPPPSIDVSIATGITRLDESGPTYRGHRLDELVDVGYEAVAELLWTGSLPDRPIHWESLSPAGADDADTPMAAIARLVLDLDDGTDGPDAARRLLASIPDRLGTPVPTSESLAHRLTGAWVRSPSPELVRAVDAALVLLADHELATSTLAVRVATSTRSSTTACLLAGLATVSGELHGGAARQVHLMLADASRRGPATALDDAIARRGRAPGFGHSIYRARDPRYDVLMRRIAAIPADPDRRQTIEHLVSLAGARLAAAPNIDLAVGTLTRLGGLPPDAPIFAIARIAGWTAHHLEELDEQPLRFRGLAR